jgi:hypothetical protein
VTTKFAAGFLAPPQPEGCLESMTADLRHPTRLAPSSMARHLVPQALEARSTEVQ